MRSRKWPVLGVAVAVLLTVMAGPAARALPSNTVDFIRGQGSDTTWVLMENLDKAFNNTVGCPITNNAGRTDTLTSNPDSSCTPWVGPASFNAENWDHDMGLTFYPVGSGNGVLMLTSFGSSGQCGTGNPPNPGVFGDSSCPYLSFDYARSSSAPGGSTDPHLRFVAYARDGLPWGNFRSGTGTRPASAPFNCTSSCTFDESTGPAAGVTTLSQQNLKDIYLNCKLTGQTRAPLWSDFGGSHVGQPDDAIIVWTDQQGSGTRKFWDSSVGGDTRACIPTKYRNGNFSDGERVVFENDPTPIRGCLGSNGGSCADGTQNTVVGSTQSGTPLEPNLGQNTDLSSIYPMSFGVYNSFVADPAWGNQKALGIDLGSIDGVAPTANSINSPPIGGPAFPFSRFMYNVYRATFSGPGSNNAPASVTDYIGEKGWICKGSVAEIGADTTDADQRGGHITDPSTNVNYAAEIANVISGTGFVPLSFDLIGGSSTGKSHCRNSGPA